MGETKVKQTLWLERAGHFDTDDHGNFDHDIAMQMKIRWVIKKAQNILSPRVGEYVDEDYILGLINDGITMNMS